MSAAGLLGPNLVLLIGAKQAAYVVTSSRQSRHQKPLMSHYDTTFMLPFSSEHFRNKSSHSSISNSSLKSILPTLLTHKFCVKS